MILKVPSNLAFNISMIPNRVHLSDLFVEDRIISLFFVSYKVLFFKLFSLPTICFPSLFESFHVMSPYFLLTSSSCFFFTS